MFFNNNEVKRSSVQEDFLKRKLRESKFNRSPVVSIRNQLLLDILIKKTEESEKGK